MSGFGLGLGLGFNTWRDESSGGGGIVGPHVGTSQAQTNSAPLPAGSAVGDMALFVATVNTSSSAAGVQGIASGPSGFTSLFAPFQVSTSPVFITSALYWKVLNATDISNGAVAFTKGSLATIAACQLAVFRGGNTMTLVTSGGAAGGGTGFNTSTPTKPASSLLMIFALALRADFNEAITVPNANWIDDYVGAEFGGGVFYRDVDTWVNAEFNHWGFATVTGGEQWYVSISQV